MEQRRKIKDIFIGVVIAIFVGFLFLSTEVLFLNYSLFDWVVSSSLDFSEKAIFITNLYKNSATSWSLAVAVLLGLNISVLIYLWREKRKFVTGGNIFGFLGFSGGILSIGCSLCGFLVASSLFSFLGVAGFIASLPFGGRELSTISIFFLLTSLYFIWKSNSPGKCEADFDLPDAQKRV